MGGGSTDDGTWGRESVGPAVRETGKMGPPLLEYGNGTTQYPKGGETSLTGGDACQTGVQSGKPKRFERGIQEHGTAASIMQSKDTNRQKEA